MTDEPAPGQQPEPTPIELEARLIEQDHRLVFVLIGLFTKRHTYAVGDPRRDAYARALLFNLFSTRTATTIGIAGASLLSLLIALQANEKLEAQNRIAALARRVATLERIDASIEALEQVRIGRAGDEVDPHRKRYPAPIGQVVCNEPLSRSADLYLANFDPGVERAYDRAALLARVLAEDEANARRLNWFSSAPAPRLNPERGYFALRYINHAGIFRDAERLDLPRADLRGVNIVGRQFNAMNLDNASFEGATLDGDEFWYVSAERADFSGVSALNACFGDVILRGADFSNAELSGAVFIDVNLDGAVFDNAKLVGARFNRPLLGGNTLADANFDGAILCYDPVNGACVPLEELDEAGVTHLSPAFEIILASGRWMGREETYVDGNRRGRGLIARRARQ